ncbi:DapH/DapD/GlmU-related protein [uncultured Paludibaculum sp.]|uniref:DapH/DapD/GlmU-related protein n=1 Tax=uncultured Paludibaculum sp. TaxID=1765020 RepID=UPI00374D4BFA
MPWNLILEDRSCLGSAVRVYNLGPIVLEADCTIAQEAYLCTGTHQFDSPRRELVTAGIRVGRRAFVGARAFVCPGVDIGEEAIVGACAVVTKDVRAGSVVAGNPAREIKRRIGGEDR